MKQPLNHLLILLLLISRFINLQIQQIIAKIKVQLFNNLKVPQTKDKLNKPR